MNAASRPVDPLVAQHLGAARGWRRRRRRRRASPCRPPAAAGPWFAPARWDAAPSRSAGRRPALRGLSPPGWPPSGLPPWGLPPRPEPRCSLIGEPLPALDAHAAGPVGRRHALLAMGLDLPEDDGRRPGPDQDGALGDPQLARDQRRGVRGRGLGSIGPCERAELDALAAERRPGAGRRACSRGSGGRPPAPGSSTAPGRRRPRSSGRGRHRRRSAGPACRLPSASPSMVATSRPAPAWASRLEQVTGGVAAGGSSRS